MKEKRTNRRENNEIRGMAAFLAAAMLLYLVFVCAVKGYSFVMVGVFLAAVLLSVLAAMVAARLTE